MNRLTVMLAATPLAFGQAHAAERQLTTSAQGHVLTNVNVWSPDGQWIVYDTRQGDAFNGTTIEQVNVTTGQVQRLYTSSNGANCGVVTYNPVQPRVVFILGPEQPTPEWNYHFTRRRGAFVDTAQPGVAHALDAMNYAPPFTAGALRGGSHVHVFNPAGDAVSFTYEDDVLAKLDAQPSAPAHEKNQRTLGVSVRAAKPVRVAKSHPRNNDGEWFTVLAARTVAQPEPGSDDISRACEEGWVGLNGYLKPNGRRQRRALAFQGTVVGRDGRNHVEVFIVDLPDDLTVAGDTPLGGTATTKPGLPRGAVQRRLTFTETRLNGGVAAVPRHWLRVSSDGSRIAFLMKDDAGVVQLWAVSPNGGPLRQITRNASDIASAFTWGPDDRSIAHVMDGSVCVTDVISGETTRLTPAVPGASGPSALACVFSPDGKSIAYTREVSGPGGTFPQIFLVAATPSEKP